MNKDELHNEIIEDFEVKPKNGQIPAFLNVLTILTFVGSGLALVTALYNLTTIEEQKANIALLKSMGQSNVFGSDFIESAQLALDNVYLMQGTAIAVAIICIVGAYFMRQLKKTGYMLYVGASVVSVVVPLAIVGLGTMGVFVLLGSIFTIAFVIMYSVNLKHLH